MNLLVTGGAGFLGSHFVRAALAGDYDNLPGVTVTVLDRLTYAGNFANLTPGKRLDFVPGDTADAALADILVPRHDAIVHFAAETSTDRSLTDATPFTTTNVTGTQVLLQAALRHGTRKFVQVSTGAVYGPVTTGASTERSPLAPTTPYAATKAAADLLALAYHHSHDLPVVVTRAADTYGTHQHPEKPIPRIITALLDGRPAPLHGDGTHLREWLHADDHCRAIALALTDGRPGQTYHIGGTVELPDHTLLDLLRTACGTPTGHLHRLPDHPAHDRRRALDDDKTRRELGWRPHVEFDTGLDATVAWYRAHPDWWRPLTPG